MHYCDEENDKKIANDHYNAMIFWGVFFLIADINFKEEKKRSNCMFPTSLKIPR